MAHAWYIIHTLSGQEQKVVDSINKRIDSEEMGPFINEVFVAKEKSNIFEAPEFPQCHFCTPEV